MSCWAPLQTFQLFIVGPVSDIAVRFLAPIADILA